MYQIVQNITSKLKRNKNDTFGSSKEYPSTDLQGTIILQYSEKSFWKFSTHDFFASGVVTFNLGQFMRNLA